MLKIREYDDNGNKIDLKELEKYGFKEYNDCYSRLYKTDTSTIINKETREIRDIDIDSFLTIVDLGESKRVNDLIKADLVEKCGDDND